MRKCKLFILVALLVFSVNGAAFGWGTGGGDGTHFNQLQETAVFLNNSGGTLTAGEVVVLDTRSTGPTAVLTGTTLGSYVTTARQDFVQNGVAQADSIKVVGVVKSTSVADQLPVVVVTKGPVDTQCDDSGDAVTIDAAVGTSGDEDKHCGGGSRLGWAMEAGDGTDSGLIMIWVNFTGT